MEPVAWDQQELATTEDHNMFGLQQSFGPIKEEDTPTLGEVVDQDPMLQIKSKSMVDEL